MMLPGRTRLPTRRPARAARTRAGRAAEPAEPRRRLPRTSRSRSSSEPGVLPPPPPGSEGAGSAGWAARSATEASATAPEHPVGEPGQHHRRKDREQLLHQVAAETGASDRRQAAEPVDDLVLLVTEDVARDGGAVLLVDRRQVGSAGEQVVVVLAEGLQDRPGTGRVTGVRLEAPEQRRQHRGRAGAHLVGAGTDLLRDLVGRQRAEDVVDCGHEVPFPASADRLRRSGANLDRGGPGGTAAGGHRCRVGA